MSVKYDEVDLVFYYLHRMPTHSVDQMINEPCQSKSSLNRINPDLYKKPWNLILDYVVAFLKRLLKETLGYKKVSNVVLQLRMIQSLNGF